MKKTFHFPYLLLIVLLSFDILLRFYNLEWGAPFFFHPDERNIATAISSIHLPFNGNPHFFAYGSLPIYTIYILGMGMSLLNHLISHTFIPRDLALISFENALVIGRVLSAIFSTVLIPLVVMLTYKLKGRQAGIIAGILTTTSIGLIQFAHFATFEMWLTFFTVLLFLTCILYVQYKNQFYLLVSFILVGILVSIKVSSLILLPILPLVYFMVNKPTLTKRFSVSFFATMIPYSIILIFVYLFFCPFTILDFQAFSNSMNYESSVALGHMDVFYTQGFSKTPPVLFQFFYDYPFLVNPFVTVLFIPSFFYVIYQGFTKKIKGYILLNVFYCLLFFSQAFLFVKWLRYIVPTLPFLYIITAIAISDLLTSTKKIYAFIILLCISTICSVYALAFLLTTYAQPDSRIQAALWAKNHISSKAKILTESYDLGILPFNMFFQNISLFNFYDLDSPLSTTQELKNILKNTQYIILPSQRVMRTRLSKPGQFPKGHAFYSQFFSHQNTYSIIYRTPCDFWCRMVYSGDEINHVEETANIFDRPTIVIIHHETNKTNTAR